MVLTSQRQRPKNGRQREVLHMTRKKCSAEEDNGKLARPQHPSKHGSRPEQGIPDRSKDSQEVREQHHHAQRDPIDGQDPLHSTRATGDNVDVTRTDAK